MTTSVNSQFHDRTFTGKSNGIMGCKLGLTHRLDPIGCGPHRLRDVHRACEVPGIERIMSMEAGWTTPRSRPGVPRHELVYIDNLIVTDKLIGPVTWRTSTTAAQFALKRAFGPTPSVPDGAA